MTEAPSLRCAIYTRKSSDEGLEQTFNTLHAQREAGEAYVKSQAGEGWRARRDRYDDGGHSGATMNRPALRRLLSDVAARRVDVVVVYKVDRLTRSLSDFAKIIETFDKARVSFVSVTQAFNTTTSMGRLTLNVLLSFAQFEREVTGERIRDKIAASKAKGMWMGGLPPLGYDAPTSQVTRALVVNEAEARSVRQIFARYLELGNTYALQERLMADGIKSKQRPANGRPSSGGQNFSRGALQHLLTNRTYVGETVHKGGSYPGRHPAIVDSQTFAAAQDLLAGSRQRRREHVPKAASALLHGLIFDGGGNPMDPVIYRRPKKRVYRYYVAASAGAGMGHRGEDDAIRRVPADAVEDLVRRRLAPVVGLSEDQLDQGVLRSLLARVEVHSSSVDLLVWARTLSAQSKIRMSVEALRRQLRLGDQVMTEADARLLRIRLPVRLKLRGGRSWVVAPDGDMAPLGARPDRQMIQRLRDAHAILRACGAHPDASNTQLRYARAPKSSYQMAQAKWAFLAPDVQRDLLEGRLNGSALGASTEIPLLWSEQRALIKNVTSDQQLRSH
jgi:DNA invertase Pin-like site-specific DNA recombinase